MLKKYGLIGLIALVAVLAVATFAFPLGVSAQRVLDTVAGRGPITATTTSTSTCTCPGGMGPGMMDGRGMGMRGGSDMVSVTAKLTGLSASEVITAVQGGQTFAQVAEAHNVSKDKLIAAVVADHKANLDAQVKAGTLTQAQADTMLTEMKTRITAEVDSTQLRGQGMRGGPGGRGGRGMMGQPGNSNSTQTAQPTTQP
jgi:hypothetical protein